MAVLNFEAYGSNVLQDMRAILRAAGGMSAADVLAAIDRHLAGRNAAGETAAPVGSVNRRTTQRAVECGECGGRMDLYRVNTCRGSMVGAGLKTQGVCRACGAEMFSRLSPAEIVRQGRI